MKRYPVLLLTIILLAGLVLAACATATAPPVAPVEATEEPMEEPEIVGTIRIGAALSETGTYATVGLDVRQGYDLWANYVNEELGGINIGGELYDVEIIYYDDESDADTSTKLTEQLISEDEERKVHDEIQKLTDKYVAEVDAVLAEKEKDLMQV